MKQSSSSFDSSFVGQQYPGSAKVYLRRLCGFPIQETCRISDYSFNDHEVDEMRNSVYWFKLLSVVILLVDCVPPTNEGSHGGCLQRNWNYTSHFLDYIASITLLMLILCSFQVNKPFCIVLCANSVCMCACDRSDYMMYSLCVTALCLQYSTM